MYKPSKDDILYMRKALKLARTVKGFTHPNPAVGAVIVKNKKIVGLGNTQEYGKDHAEVVALKKAGVRAKGGDMYVTLEPCSHYGKTPPCTDAIIKAGIKRVFYAVKDFNPIVCGMGHKKLEKAGITVINGIEEKASAKINEDFFKFSTSKIPFVSLKIAQTIDGKIACDNGNSKWITNKKARMEVHKLRSNYNAILVGINTVINDNPTLNVRMVKGVNPIRIILDSKNRLPKNSNIVKTAGKIRTIVACIKKPQNPLLNIEYWEFKSCKNKISIKKLLKKVGRENIVSVFVEGGAGVFSSFFKAKLFDKLFIFIGNRVLGSGINGINITGVKSISNALELYDMEIKKLDDNIMISGYPLTK